MKRTSLLLLAMAATSSMAMAKRENDQRTLTTRVADLLAEMPARDQQHLEASMSEMAAMGKEGILAMKSMLSTPGKGDDSKIEFALDGFSYYVMQSAREDWRKMSVDAYCESLAKASNPENKAFLIQQLQRVGNEDAVPCLQGYLGDVRLCAPAANALTSINSTNGETALLQALQSIEGDCRFSLVEALGDTRHAAAVASLTPLASSQDVKLRKLSLYALANIADLASEDVLARAAQEDGYTYDHDNATAAYILYASRLAEDGKQHQAEKIAETLLHNTS
ncbi:HEAT repeat domain-containing protein [Pontibacter korlensis]|uniref:HEAT repeat domain-containing protein n=1 Tax=Pontibacter korlensis TaxID=400092 RepID=UPI00191008FB|nr:HEAT repeat domain-containing protein [Pontibacter korlensis]